MEEIKELNVNDGKGLWTTAGLIESVIQLLNRVEVKGTMNMALLVDSVQRLASVLEGLKKEEEARKKAKENREKVEEETYRMNEEHRKKALQFENKTVNGEGI